jgi:hypothetical protein
MALIALKLDSLKIAEIIQLAQKVHDYMSTNAATFAAPVVPLVDLQGQIDTTSAAQSKLPGGSKAETAIRDAELEILEGMLKQMGAYIQAVSGGDITIIHLAGLDVRQIGPRKYLTVDAPEALVAKMTFNPGEIKLRWKSGRNAVDHEIEWCPAPIVDNGWRKGGTSTARKILLKDLPSGAIVHFRVRAKAAAGESAWSAPTSSRVA